MTAQDYIQSRLAELKQPVNSNKPDSTEDLVQAIYTALLSKKFRKYAASEELKIHVLEAIRLNVEQDQPINITFLHGAYKLWRLEESPEADWAELFSLMHYTRWVKPVCDIYGPGVWFDFFVDDLIVPKLDNVPIEDIRTYIRSYQQLIDFLRPYQPSNLNMTITPVGSRFESEAAFNASLQRNLDKLTAETPGGLPVLTEAQAAMVEFNVKVTDEQRTDPHWREKVFRLHNAYAAAKAEPGYHKNRPEKILAFTTSLPMAIAVGTTKDSIMKFWVGAGVLRPADDGSYRQIIMSPRQLQTAEYSLQDVRIDNLEGRNFTRIRVLNG